MPVVACSPVLCCSSHLGRPGKTVCCFLSCLNETEKPPSTLLCWGNCSDSWVTVSPFFFIPVYHSGDMSFSPSPGSEFLVRTGTTAHSPLQCPQHPAQYLALVKCSKKVNRSNAYGRDTQTMFPDAKEFHRDISEGTTRLMRELSGWSSESQNKVLWRRNQWMRKRSWQLKFLLSKVVKISRKVGMQSGDNLPEHWANHIKYEREIFKQDHFREFNIQLPAGVPEQERKEGGGERIIREIRTFKKIPGDKKGQRGWVTCWKPKMVKCNIWPWQSHARDWDFSLFTAFPLKC